MGFNKLNQTMALKLAKSIGFLEWIEKHGIGFMAGINGLSGIYNLTPDEVIEFITDEELLAAKKANVPLSVFRRWIERDGLPQCGAKTKSGRRCRNVPMHPDNVYICGDIKKFEKYDGEYCHIHEGGRK